MIHILELETFLKQQSKSLLGEEEEDSNFRMLDRNVNMPKCKIRKISRRFAVAPAGYVDNGNYN